ncbi:MAG: SEC-C metal-binding domain-containing protein [Acidimicrobiia bacterium]
MDSTRATTAIETLTDDQLLGLLRTEEDRLSRAAVDEFIRRGDRLVEPLAAICGDEKAWDQSDALFWTPVHATYLLGAIGTERALDGLLAALKWSLLYEVDWVGERIADILGAVGRPALEPLKAVLANHDRSEFERSTVAHALGAVAARHPVFQGDILDHLRGVAEDRREPYPVGEAAADVLLRFARPGDRPVVESWAKRAERRDDIPMFDREEVAKAYERGTSAVEDYLRDWLEFYRPEEIDARQKRWAQEEEVERWQEGAEEESDWVHKEHDRILEKYRDHLGDVDEDTLQDAMWIADSMVQYLCSYEGAPPWSWDPGRAVDYLSDHFVRKMATDDARTVRSAPDHVLRFVLFWESEGKLSAAERVEIERAVEKERRVFIRAALDPSRWGMGKGISMQMAADGVEVTDQGAVQDWIMKYNMRLLGPRQPAPVLPFPSPEPAPAPKVGRNAPCPCGSGKKFKRCCGG